MGIYGAKWLWHCTPFGRLRWLVEKHMQCMRGHSCLVGDDRRAASEEMHDRPAGFIQLRMGMGPMQCKQEQMLPMYAAKIRINVWCIIIPRPDFHDHASRPAGPGVIVFALAGQGRVRLQSCLECVVLHGVRTYVFSNQLKACIVRNGTTKPLFIYSTSHQLRLENVFFIWTFRSSLRNLVLSSIHIYWGRVRCTLN